MKNPRFLMTSINIVSFVNKGKYRKPGKDQLSPEELQSIEKMDITDSIDVLTESYNIYYNKQETTFCNKSKVDHN